MNETVTHKAIVRQRNACSVLVELKTEGNCSLCQAKEFCGQSEDKPRLIEVPANAVEYSVGEEIRVEISKSAGKMAIILGYVLPFFIVMLMMIWTLSMDIEEWICGLIALLSILPYYLIVGVLVKNSHKFKMKIYKNEETK